MFRYFAPFVLDDRGQGLVEYSLILSLIAIVAVAGLSFLGTKSNVSLNNSVSQIP